MPEGAGSPALATIRPAAPASDVPAPQGLPLDPLSWAALIERAQIRGPARELAMNAVPLGLDGSRLRLGLDAAHEALAIDATLARLGDALAPQLGLDAVRIVIERAAIGADSPAACQRRAADAAQRAAEQAVASDPLIRELMQEFGGRVVPGSIRPNPRE